MKRIFTLFTLTILLFFQGFAQNTHVNYDRDTRWFLGINGGGTWHNQTETKYQIRGGYGFVIGASIGMDPKKLFSWDVRGRFLHAYFGGQSTTPYALDSASTSNLGYYGTSLNTYRDSLGYFIPNFRTTLLSGSLELVLNTNRLRERTGWNFYLFGGIGIKGYHTKADLFQGTSETSIYDYDNANTGSQASLMSLQDNEYETDLVGTDSDFEVDWMPSFGVGLSYQLSPAVAMGIEHKMTWTRNNTWDGMPNDISTGTATNVNDIYHYSALTFKFHLFNGHHHSNNNDVTVYDNVDQNNNVTQRPPQKEQKPIVDIYDPGSSPYTTDYNHFLLKANVYYVAGKQNITFKQNGMINNNFSYNANTDKFESNVVLNPGQNLFEITAVNEDGSDYETTIIIYQPEVIQPQPPIVSISNPPYTPYTVNYSTFNFVGQVLNVETKSQIKMYFNGVYVSTFNFNPSTNAVTATLNLHEGTNTVTLTGTNNVGSDSKTVNIIYNKPVTLPPPVVSFINPANDPHITASPTYNLQASVLNVAAKSDITVKVNGVQTTAFNFNTSSKIVTMSLNLIEGANVIEIKGVNTVGMDVESTTIIYEKPAQKRPPVVTFQDPGTNPIVVYSSSYNVMAQVLHVGGYNDITLRINGVQTGAFSYSTSSKLMAFTVNLLPGSNVIEVTGTNNDGTDVETTTIIYKQTIPQAPPIVNITYPATDNQVFASPNITLTASVLNVSGPANIQVLVNGSTTTNFTYNTYTKILTLPLTLVQGNNTVHITGTNSAGSDSDTRIIIHQLPQVPQPPTVDFVNPPSSPYLVTNPAFTVTAVTTNIDDKSQIVFKQNGVLINDAAYTFTSTHQIIYNSALIAGNNIFEVTVSNADGSASDMVIVTYDEPNIPCIIPTVGYISPVPYSTVNDPNVTIDAQINNWSAGTTVELLINGISQGFMTYNTGTSIASKATTLVEGSNAVTVIVTNDCGSNQATFTLNYQAPQAPCDDPLITALSSTSQTTQSSTVNLQAGVLNIAGASDIAVTLNGSSIAFNYDAGTNTININNVNLAIGNNAIVVTATTDCGSSTVVFNVVREVCNPPSISALSHNNAAHTTDASINFSAVVSNATQSEIELLVNGISQSFSYNASTGQLTAGISLNVGVNSIIIQVGTNCGSDAETLNIIRDIPCQQIAPSLISPASPTATVTSSNYEIQLHVNGTLDASGITVTQNGNSIPFTFDQVSANITISNITLVDGTNAITVSMTNPCSSINLNYNITYDGCQPPVISFASPANNAVINSGLAQLSATVSNSNGAANITLLVNGQPESFNFNEGSGVLTADVSLNPGSNSIEIQVNGCEQANQSINVNYVIPCDPITYTLMQPSSNTATTMDGTYNISLSTTGLNNGNQIAVTNNGQSVPFNYDSGTQIITVNNINLNSGLNTIVVSMSNDCSNQSVSYAVTYTPCQPPVITTSGNSASVAVPVYPFTCNVTNVSNQNEIQVLFNGAPTAFVFDPATGNVQGEVTLQEGSSTITINANGCASATASFSVNYTIPCEPITYTLGTPNQLTASTADEIYSINLVAQHVIASNITVTLNGNSVPFTLDNNVLSISNMTLVDGANAIVVSMSNDCSNETVTYTINYDGCDAPVIDISANADAVSASQYNFTATVQHIDNQNQLSLTLNGNNTAFTFDAATHLVTAQFNLNEGSNTIVLNANGCDAATATMTVAYTIPCNPIGYTLGSPAQLNSTVQGATTSLSISTTDVDPATISVTLNGTAVNHTFNSGVIAVSTVNLIEGQNTLVVNFGNACSNESVTFNIDSDQCDAPVINLSTNQTTVTDPLYDFTGTVSNIDNTGQLALTVNGNSVTPSYNAGTGTVTAQFSLLPGDNTVILTANGCETAGQEIIITYNVPCVEPLISVDNTSMGTSNASYTFTCTVDNVSDASGITVTLNGNSVAFTWDASTHVVSAPMTLQPGDNTVGVTGVGCATTSVNYTVHYDACDSITYTLMNPSSLDFTSENQTFAFQLNTQHVANSSGVSVTLNGSAVTPTFFSGQVSMNNITLNEGLNTIVIVLTNDCSTETLTYNITYAPEVAGPCGPRFNPGNSEWEFCLITPTGTYNRDDLAANSNFTYSGPASSAYFKPIAGGGDAIVNGQPYQVQNGQYYLFTGNLTVDVSSNHPGSMGHWQICITADNEPEHGNGNNRPESPCEATNGNGNGNGGGNNNGDSGSVDYTVNGDGGVSVNETVCATITCLGESVVYNNSQDAFVTVEFSIDGGSTWYQFNNNNFVNGGESVTVEVPQGGEVALKSICVNANGNWSNTEISNTNSQYVYVLQNGQPAPAYDPAQGQASLETFLAGYIDGNGNVTIGPNDVIYLFELRFVGTYGIDYQDCVMLVEFDDNATCSPPSGPTSNTGNQHGQIFMTPEISNISPKSSTTTVDNPNFSFSTKITNVNVKDDINIYLNGAVQKSVNFNEGTGVASVNLTLKDGSNEVTIEAVNGNKSSSKTYTITYNRVVEVVKEPTITNINPITTSSNTDRSGLNFSATLGNVKNQENVTITLNGATQKGINYVASTGLVTSTLTLKEGANTIVLTAVNGDKTVSRTYTVNYNKPVPVVKDPVITNGNPGTTSISTDRPTIAFSAKIDNIQGKDNISISLNGVDQRGFAYNTSTQMVTANFTLKEGNNQIVLTARNGDKTASRTYTVMYAKPVVNTPTPEFGFITPTSNAITVSSPTYTLKAQVRNVNSKDNITVYVNGKITTGFTYSSTKNELMVVLKLNPGANIVKIDAKNGDKSASTTYTITYTQSSGGTDSGTNNTEKPAVAPVITNVTPGSTSFTVSTPTFSFKAKVDNISSKNDVKLTVNGKTYTGFTYSSSSKYVSAVITLQEGANTIKLDATNGDKTTTRTYTITYKKASSGTKEDGGSGTGGGTNSGGGTKTESGGGTKTGTGGGTNSGGGTKTETGGGTKETGGGSENKGTGGGRGGF